MDNHRCHEADTGVVAVHCVAGLGRVWEAQNPLAPVVGSRFAYPTS